MRALLLLLAGAVLPSCPTLSGTMSVTTTKAHPWPAHVMVGASEVDVTPPPGVSLYGHGPESRVSTGAELRLSCHALVFGSDNSFEQLPGDMVVLIPCELPMPSLLVQRRVAERVQAAGLPMGADRIFLMATHTHAGPAHYFATENLSSIFSSRLYGFDSKMVEFLVERIADAVTRAFYDRAPARLGWAWADVRGFSRNRNLRAFLHNEPTPAAIRKALSDPTLRRRYARSELAVDPTLRVLRIDHRVNGTWVARAVLVNFGVHPTALPNETDTFSGDLFGYARRWLSKRLDALNGARLTLAGASPDSAKPVRVAFVTGIAGDVTSSRDFSGPSEARRIGEALAAEVAALWHQLELRPNALKTRQVVRVAYRELDFKGARLYDPARSGCQPNLARLCDNPSVGTASAGGGPDHPTRLRLFTPLAEGARAKPKPGSENCHAPKFPMQAPGGPPEAGISFPRYGPMGLIQIGDALLVTVPLEPTTTTGLRIIEAIRGATTRKGWRGPVPETIGLVSLTNEYFQYTATCAEYQLQHYEGSSTLYGPKTSEFLVEQAGFLAAAAFAGGRDRAAQLGQPCVGKVLPIAYEVHDVRILPSETTPTAEGRLTLVHDKRPTIDGRFGQRVWWFGPEPGAFLHVPVEPRVSVLRVNGLGAGRVVVDDDTGSSLTVRYVFHDKSSAYRWEALWTPRWSNRDWRCHARYQFLVRGSLGQEQRSAEFELQCPTTLEVDP